MKSIICDPSNTHTYTNTRTRSASFVGLKYYAWMSFWGSPHFFIIIVMMGLLSVCSLGVCLTTVGISQKGVF